MIDTHLHLWDPATIRRSWLAAVPELDRPFLLGDYQSMASMLGITAAVHVESDVNEAELDREMGEVAAVMDVSP
ncbi:MAG: amidohydrolase, partial [Planctomycetia bacterium]|nr:amidohydrolase [Planctomycetia bacterium]